MKEIKIIEHKDMAYFIVSQFNSKSVLIFIYKFIQYAFLISFIGFFVMNVIQNYENKNHLLSISFKFSSILWFFPFLVFIHESIHALAYKVVGVNNVYFGAILKKLMFYAASDREVINGRQFLFVAFAPFVVISLILISAVFLFPNYLPVILSISTLHIISCSGDFGLANYIIKIGAALIYTEDFREECITKFYIKE